MFYLKRRYAPVLLLALSGLPAAMAQSTAFTTASAGNWTAFVAPNSIAAGFGVGLAPFTTVAPSLPLGTTLGGATLTITDSAGAKTAAPIYMVSPGQLNYLIPGNVALGKATVSVTSSNNTTLSGTLEVSNLSPAVFAAGNTGAGVAAAQFLIVDSTGKATVQNTATAGVLFYVPSPVSLSPATNKVYLILYGTGFRNRSANPVKVSINGVLVPVLYAAAQGTLPGLDQINVGPLPQTLAGTGKPSLNVVVTVDGIPANTTTIAIQ